MCQIRIIIRRGTDIIQDSIKEINTELGVVERPSYIEIMSEEGHGIDEEHNIIVFHYSGSTERYTSVTYNNILVVYGEISGRIKKVEINKDQLNETDKFTLYHSIEGEKKAPLRFFSNFNNGLAIVNKVLEINNEKQANCEI